MPDDFVHGVDRYEWFEHATFEPVAPDAVRERLADGAVLATTDVPDHLDRSLVVEVDTGLVLYRLVQLFGTPNVPGLAAGGDQPDRHLTTWQYLFEFTHDPEEGEPTSALVSVYDYRTELSVGVSTWRRPDEMPERRVPEPTGDGPVPAHLDEDFLLGAVQAVLHTVEDPVRATFEELWL